MGFLSGLISKLTGGTTQKAQPVAPSVQDVPKPLVEPPPPHVGPKPVVAPVSHSAPASSVPFASCVEPAIRSTAPLSPTVQVDAKVLEKLQDFRYVTDSVPSPVPPNKQWWGIQSQSSERHRWLEPFIPPAVAELDEFKGTFAAGVSKADRVAISLRGLIRPRVKAKEPHEELLRGLFGACLMRDFVGSLATDDLTLPDAPEMAEFVHIDELRTVQCDFPTVGYRHLGSLGKTDIKWLVNAFGEPTEHKTIEEVFQLVRKQAIARYCWKELNSSELAARHGSDKQTAMRDWLTIQIKLGIDRRKALEVATAKINAAAARIELQKTTVFQAISAPFIVVDLETTGFNTQADSILELVAVRSDPTGAVLAEFGALVRVKQAAPVYVSELKSISMEDIEREGRPLAEVLTEFCAFAGTAPLFFHSGPVGTGFVIRAASALSLPLGNPVHDTLFMPATREGLGAANEDTYKALADARNALAVLVKLRADARHQHKTVVVASAQPNSLHWPPKGVFPVSVVGEDYRRETLAGLARNPPGKPALVYCTATLVPEDTNPHDANAILVAVEGQHVGYLSKEFAADYRGYFRTFNLKIQRTTCDAVICKGLVADGKTYAYAVELDLLPDLGPPEGRQPTHKSLLRMNTDPVFVKQPNGSYFVETWLSGDAFEDVDDRADVSTWTADNWTDINYYLPNKFGAGFGHKLFQVPKDLHARMFGYTAPDIRIEVVKGRMLLLSLTPYLEGAYQG